MMEKGQVHTCSSSTPPDGSCCCNAFMHAGQQPALAADQGPPRCTAHQCNLCRGFCWVSSWQLEAQGHRTAGQQKVWQPDHRSNTRQLLLIWNMH